MVSLVEKYRPLTLDGFVGMQEPKAVLNAVVKQPYSSAWLLTGAPGVGKTTIAQAFFDAIGGQVQHIPARMCDLETVNRVCESCPVRTVVGWLESRVVRRDRYGLEAGASRMVEQPGLDAVPEADCVRVHQQ
jgi:hypothetical protein